MREPSLAVCVEGPPHVVRKSLYAATELLAGLGLAVERVGRADAQLYVGPDPEMAPPSALRLRQSAATAAALARPAAADPSDLGWLGLDGERWPLPVGPTGTPSVVPGEVVEADVVGSAFWWLAGWQEAGTTARDVHGRYGASAALQVALGDAPGGLARPAVDAYRRWLAASLRACGVDVPGRTWGGASWALVLTHDVDALRTRRLRSAASGLLRGRPADGLRRALGPDRRWSSLQALLGLERRHDVASTLFLKGGATAPEDVPYSLDDPGLADLVRQWRGRGGDVGLHPSYAAADHPARLRAERDRLAALVGEPPRTVRMHFLRWLAPTTPRALAQIGFEVDATLGFSAEVGYRRGTAQPFRLWDIHADAPQALVECPLAVMDTTLFDHQRLGADAAFERAWRIIEGAREAEGAAVLLWHNDMGATPSWSSRAHTLDRIIGHALGAGAFVGSVMGAMNAWGRAFREEQV